MRGSIISGSTTGRGGQRLALYLANIQNIPQDQETRLGTTRGIVAASIKAAILELTTIASHARCKKPVLHVHVDPESRLSDAEELVYWSLLEDEFGLKAQPYVEAIHVKLGRQHYHRVYCLVRPDGNVIGLRNAYARHEKINRIAEFTLGGSHILGRHNRSVAHWLRHEGRADVADSMERAGLTMMDRPMARMTPSERHQAERTEIDPVKVRDFIWKLWQNGKSNNSFLRDLASAGLELIKGRRVPIVLDSAGGPHSLTRMIAQASRLAGTPVLAAEIHDRLKTIFLSTLQPVGERNDRSKEAIFDRLDAADNFKATQGSRLRGFRSTAEPYQNFGRNRQPGSNGARIGNTARPSELSRYKHQARQGLDTEPGRDIATPKSEITVGGNRESDAYVHQGTSEVVRASERDRCEDIRVTTALGDDYPETGFDELLEWAGSLDRDLAVRHHLEDFRVERMLNEPSSALHLSMVASLLAAVSELVQELMRLIFESVNQAFTDASSVEISASDEPPTSPFLPPPRMK